MGRGINFSGKNIILRSQYGPGNCIIDCENNNRAFVFNHAESSQTVLEGFTIRNGFAEDGGGIYCNQSNPTIRNCIITNNSASDYGGGIHSQNCSPTIINCSFSDNSAVDFGGAIYALGQRIKISNCIFENNSANRGGGILYQSSKNTDISNCIFRNNLASRGGGICYQASTDYNMIINNCTFTANSGSAVYLYWSTATMNNCILWSNSSYDVKLTSSSYSSTFTICYTDLQGGPFSIYKDSGCTLNWGVGNINENPLFVGGNDFRLLADSPCIDAGDNDSVPEGITTDLDGHNRFVDDPCTPDTGAGTPPIVDMGAYERGICGDADHPHPAGDINSDCEVDINDAVIMALAWLSEDGGGGWNPDCEIGLVGDGIISWPDFAVMSQGWLECTKPECD